MIEHDERFTRVEGVDRCDGGFGHENAEILVIIPTYNEKGNVARMLSKIASLHMGGSFDALIVDDGSTDGTRESVREYAKSANHGVYLMSRKGKFGLGNAYVDAYRWMFAHMRAYQTIVHMDADFSHDPNMIPLLISQSRAYGAAVGSRYVGGGCTPDWSWSRVLISVLGNFYMRVVLKIFFPSYPIKDSTAGFIAWKREVLADVLQYDIPGDGYSFLTAEKLIAFRMGFPAIEVPIVFRDRRLGISKITKGIIFEALMMPWRLAIKFRHIAFSSSLLPPPEVQDGGEGQEGGGESDGTGVSSFESRLAAPRSAFDEGVSFLISRLWLFIPFLFAALLYLAFIIPGAINGFHPWWRIPVASQVAPDAYLYQTWLGAVVQGLPQGQFFYWYIPIFRFLWAVTGGQWSIPEFLLLTYILSSIASVLILSWTVKQWASHLSLRQRRLLSVAFLSIWTLVLGFRPGYYSWYAPVIFFGFGALGIFRIRCRERRWLQCAYWALLSLIAFFIYPWCFLFAGTYIIATLAHLLFQSVRKPISVAFFVFAITSCSAVFSGIFIGPMFFHSSLINAIDLYSRTAVATSHMPFISNALFVIIGWIILGYSGFARDEEGFGHLIGWLCLLLLWLDYPFTGIFLFNEHFMQIIAPFGLFSLGFLMNTNNVEVKKKRWHVIIFLLSCCSVVLYVFKSIAPGGSIRLFIIHLINWIPLAIASAFMIFPASRKKVMFIGVAGLLCFGAWGYFSIVSAQTHGVGDVVKIEPVIEWVRRDGSAQTRYCSDAETSRVLAAHTGRAFYPSEAMLFEPVSDRVEEDRLDAIAYVFDVDGAGHREVWNNYVVNARLSPCMTFPFQEAFLRRIGMSQARIDAITGCSRDVIQSRLSIVTHAVQHENPIPALSTVCDRVIIRDDLQPFWHLSSSEALLTHIAGYQIYAVH